MMNKRNKKEKSIHTTWQGRVLGLSEISHIIPIYKTSNMLAKPKKSKS